MFHLSFSLPPKLVSWSLCPFIAFLSYTAVLRPSVWPPGALTTLAGPKGLVLISDLHLNNRPQQWSFLYDDLWQNPKFLFQISLYFSNRSQNPALKLVLYSFPTYFCYYFACFKFFFKTIFLSDLKHSCLYRIYAAAQNKTKFTFLNKISSSFFW